VDSLPLSLAQRVLLAAIRGYQLIFSPMFAGSCRFVPSCSAYAAEAVQRHGVVRGSVLSLRRLARCRPLARHGFDPVPSRFGD
jgi:putative membrane protein insertion efficiency factor